MKKDRFFNYLQSTGLTDPGQYLPPNMQHWSTVKVEEEDITLVSRRYNSSKVAIISDQKSKIPLL